MNNIGSQNRMMRCLLSIWRIVKLRHAARQTGFFPVSGERQELALTDILDSIELFLASVYLRGRQTASPFLLRGKPPRRWQFQNRTACSRPWKHGRAGGAGRPVSVPYGKSDSAALMCRTQGRDTGPDRDSASTQGHTMCGRTTAFIPLAAAPLFWYH